MNPFQKPRRFAGNALIERSKVNNRSSDNLDGFSFNVQLKNVWICPTSENGTAPFFWAMFQSIAGEIHQFLHVTFVVSF